MIWLDLETTGLDPERGSILEIALVITDNDLNVLRSFEDLICPLDGLGIEVMDDTVRKMHEESGLISDIYNGKLKPVLVKNDPEIVSENCIEFLLDDLELIGIKKMPLCGNSVHFDRAWLRKHMPLLESMFSHRHVDVSSFTLEAKYCAPEVYKGRPGLDENGNPKPAHRAMLDVLQSIETLKYYRSKMEWKQAQGKLL